MTSSLERCRPSWFVSKKKATQNLIASTRDFEVLPSIPFSNMSPGNGLETPATHDALLWIYAHPCPRWYSGTRTASGEGQRLLAGGY
jgi:hypothetical protein